MKCSRCSEEIASPTLGFAQVMAHFSTRFNIVNVTVAGVERGFWCLRLSGKQLDQHGSQHSVQHINRHKNPYMNPI